MEKELFEAAYANRLEVVRSLLRDHPTVDVNMGNEVSISPLHVATLGGYFEVTKLLLVHPNIKVNLQTFGGATPFLGGCMYGQVAVVRLMLRDPRVNIALADSNGCTPLWQAAHKGCLEVVEWLIASGRDLGDLNSEGKWRGKFNNALEVAREKNKDDVVSLLERFFANPEQTRAEIKQKLNYEGIFLFSFDFK